MNLIFEFMLRNMIKTNDELCDQFENLIKQNSEERIYQVFLEKHPALIDPLAASIIPQQSLGSEFVCDFAIRRLDDEYIIVEIEKPIDAPFVSKNNLRLSANLSRPLGQVLAWLSWLEDHKEYAEAHFPGFHSPQGLIVFGRKGDPTDKQLRLLKAFNDNLGLRIRICTYDDILNNARNIARNLTNR